MEDQADLTLLHELLDKLRFSLWESNPRITIRRCDLYGQVFVAWKCISSANLVNGNVRSRLCNAAQLRSGRLLLLLLRLTGDWGVAHPGTTYRSQLVLFS